MGGDLGPLDDVDTGAGHADAHEGEHTYADQANVADVPDDGSDHTEIITTHEQRYIAQEFREPGYLTLVTRENVKEEIDGVPVGQLTTGEGSADQSRMYNGPILSDGRCYSAANSRLTL